MCADSSCIDLEILGKKSANFMIVELSLYYFLFFLKQNPSHTILKGNRLEQRS